MPPSLTDATCQSLSRSEATDELRSLGIAVDLSQNTQRYQVTLQKAQVTILFDHLSEDLLVKLLNDYSIKSQKYRRRSTVKNYFLKNPSVQSQMLASIQEWNHSIPPPRQHHEDISSLHKVQVRFRNPGLPVFVQFLEQVPPNTCALVDELRRLSKFPSSVTAECTMVRRLVGLPFSGETQEDSHEFLTALLDKLETSLGDRSGQLTGIFNFCTKVTTTCSNRCHPTEVADPPQNTLSVSMTPQSSSLAHCLKQYFNPQAVSDRNCGVCDSTTGTRQETITQLGSVVIIHLKRYASIVRNGVQVQVRLNQDIPPRASETFNGRRFHFTGAVQHISGRL